MRCAVFFVVVVVGLALCSVEDEEHGPEFLQWADDHKISYGSEELTVRFSTWLENRAFINKHNDEVTKGMHTYAMGLNQFGAMSNDEYRRTVLGLAPPKQASAAVETFQSDDASPPDSWDWREHGIVTPVKNQASCGSCWAFSAVAAMEAAFNKKNNGTLPSLCKSTCGPKDTACCSFSEQEIVDCTLNGVCNCDKGGEMHDGYLEIIHQKKGVINTEAQYPYTSGGGSSPGKCHSKDTGVATGFTAYANVTQGDEKALAQAVVKQTVISVAIDASQPTFQFYARGVYNAPGCKSAQKDLDHGVAVVGYGSYDGPAPGPGPGPGPPGPPAPTGCAAKTDEADCDKAGCEWLAGIKVCIDKDSDLGAIPALQNSTGTDYWLVKNSWGATWGTQEGYILMSRNKNNQCGIVSDAQYPLF